MTENILLEMKLDRMPSAFGTVEVDNPLNVNNKGDYFGTIVVNSQNWSIRYSAADDLWWVSPRPDASFYEVLYSKLFYTSPLPEQFGYASLELDNTRRSEKAIKNWKDIESKNRIETRGRLLEVGCGPGEFLVEALHRGWHEVVGNELEPTSARIARERGIPIFEGMFEDMPDSYGLFDMIFADNVIEHVMDPAAFADKVRTRLRPSGLVVLRLPDTQPFGPTLKLIDHTFHFSRKSIRSLLEQGGFDVLDIFHSGTYAGTKYATDPTQRIENMTVIAKRNK